MKESNIELRGCIIMAQNQLGTAIKEKEFAGVRRQCTQRAIQVACKGMEMVEQGNPVFLVLHKIALRASVILQES